jgi:hypothetical protein
MKQYSSSGLNPPSYTTFFVCGYDKHAKYCPQRKRTIRRLMKLSSVCNKFYTCITDEADFSIDKNNDDNSTTAVFLLDIIIFSGK